MQYSPSPIVSPNTSPEQITRAVWDEFYRISFAIGEGNKYGSPNLDGGTPTTIYAPGQYIDGGSV